MAAAGDPARCPYGPADTVKLLSTVALGGRASAGRAPVAAAPAAPAGGGGCCGGGCGGGPPATPRGDRGRAPVLGHARPRTGRDVPAVAIHPRSSPDSGRGGR